MRASLPQDELIAVASAMADAASAALLPMFRSRDLVTDDKGDGRFDPVTAADRASEAAMRAVLAARRPNDSILGEEQAAKHGTSGLTWVIDPIDGTRAFISGLPTWGVLIAVNAGDEPLFGIVDQPFTGERFAGGFGRAELRRNGTVRQLGTRPCPSLSEATVFTTYPEVGTAEEGAGFHAVSRHCRLTRYGTDCYAYALLALGHVDLVIEAGLQPYDIQAPQAVVQAAGGIVTDWRGGPAHGGGRVLAAGDTRTHSAALEILREVPDNG